MAAALAAQVLDVDAYDVVERGVRFRPPFSFGRCVQYGPTLRRPLGSRLLLHAIDSDDIVPRVGLADLSGCRVFR